MSSVDSSVYSYYSILYWEGDCRRYKEEILIADKMKICINNQHDLTCSSIR